MTVRFVAILAVAHAVSIACGRPAACAVTAPTTGAASLLLDPLSLSHGMGGAADHLVRIFLFTEIPRYSTAEVA